jgi:hypothetical protein
MIRYGQPGKYSFGYWDGQIYEEALSWPNHYDKYIKPRLEARTLAKAKRPPMKWRIDENKPLPFIWGLYVKGQRIHHPSITGYDINAGVYYTYDGKIISKHKTSFIVKRLS